jgi:lysophospholipase L1-like esterase
MYQMKLAMAAGCTWLVLFAVMGMAQETETRSPDRWEKNIRKFEAKDRQEMPENGGILFVGSSSIRLWDTPASFPGETIINRGFGGCEISDVNHFFDRVVAPYQPQIIVFYAGDNDIASGETAESVVADFKTFWKSVGRQIPDCTVIYIPIKPSLSRWNLWPRMRNANQTIKQFAKQNYNLRFADIVSPMLNSEGKPRPELFVKDGLHLNAKGYQIWTRVIQGLLKETKKGMVVDAPDLTRHGETGNVSGTVLVTDSEQNGPWKVDYRFNDQPWRAMKNVGDARHWLFSYPAELAYGQHQLDIRLSPTLGSSRTVSRSIKVIEE